jgi:hypothetical protein
MPGTGPGIHGKRPRAARGSIVPMLWHHSEPFPPDPNAPLPRPQRATQLRLATEALAPAAQDADPLERELAQLRVIGPAAGAELRRIFYGHGERTAAAPATSAACRQAPPGPADEHVA